MSGIFKSLEISSMGMTVQRQKMDAVSQNIANIDTSRTADGGPYKRKRVIVSEATGATKFQAVMKQAHGKLNTTHANHISGKTARNSFGAELPTVEGREISDPEASSKIIYDPSHPEANAEGYVEMPDIEIINEMVDMISANRAYEANIAAVSSAKRMINEAMEI